MTHSEVPGSAFSGTGLRHGRAVAAAGRLAAARTALLQADTAPATPAAARPRNARRLVCPSTRVSIARGPVTYATPPRSVINALAVARTAGVRGPLSHPVATRRAAALTDGVDERGEGGRVVARGGEDDAADQGPGLGEEVGGQLKADRAAAGAARPLHRVQRRPGDRDAWHLVREVVGLLERGQRRDGEQQRDAGAFEGLDQPVERVELVDRAAHEELRARPDLGVRPRQLGGVVPRGGVDPRPDAE